MIRMLRNLDRSQRWALAAVLALSVIYVGAAWTPSHWGIAAERMGIEHAGPVFGRPHFERSDEWAVLTPYFQIAVANDFGPVNLHSPYHESLVSFFAFPSRDWSMAFKPDLWAFLVIDPAHAYSLHYALLAGAMLVGFAVLLRQLGCRPAVSVLGSAILFLSQFVQVWWTSNAPVFAWAAWPAIIFLWRAPWFVRLPAMAYAVAVWLIGFLYPPFILSAGIAFAALSLMFRPDAWRPDRLIPAAVGAAIGAALAWAHFSELIPAMAQTVYPGRRISDGGGVSILQLAAHLLPNVATWGFDPLPGIDSNVCEIGVVGSVLPLAALCFAQTAELKIWLQRNRGAMLLWLVVLSIMTAWMVAPIAGAWAPGLNMIPGPRLQWGFGLLLTVGIVRILSDVPLVLSRVRIEIFCSVVIIGWAVSKHFIANAAGFGIWFDLLPVVVLAAVLLLRRTLQPTLKPEFVVLATALISSGLTFGLFNPLQSARPIFDRADSPLLRDLRAYAQANPHHVAVVSRWYGATLNGVGIPAINHALLRPQLDFFHRAYPDMAPAAFEQVFHRYAHYTPAEGEIAPIVDKVDAVRLTPDPFAIPLRVDVVETPPAGAAAISRTEAVRIDANHWMVTIAGWAPWVGISPDQHLGVSLRAEVGTIVQATAYRLPRPGLLPGPDLVEALDDPKQFAPGFGLRMLIQTKQPVDDLGFHAILIGSAGLKH